MRIAADGANGLRLARDWRPQVILIDIRLPDFDGLELRRRLLADPATANLPCIAVTAQATAADREAAAELDFFAYVVKPFDLNALRAAIRDALATPQWNMIAIAAATVD